ncbi:hypothetical protein RZS08_23275, partial [Arthrospira platensis SPKY1]|nr:hypothetical protein [Arthrospira platensis SPKY1]
MCSGARAVEARPARALVQVDALEDEAQLGRRQLAPGEPVRPDLRQLEGAPLEPLVDLAVARPVEEQDLHVGLRPVDEDEEVTRRRVEPEPADQAGEPVEGQVHVDRVERQVDPHRRRQRQHPRTTARTR